MPNKKRNKKTVPYAQQQLTQAISQLKQGSSREEVLPMLEAVLTQLQLLVTHDSLTGALNRRTLIERLDSELQRSMRTGHTFSFAVISIDGLQDIMDKHGQDVTKQVLQIVTAEALGMLRAIDSFGRIAATEFAIVMPTTWIDQSLKAIARLKRVLSKVDWNTIAPDLKVSFSTGLTTNAPKDTSDHMLNRGLIALKKANTMGVNQLVQIEAELPNFVEDE